MDEVLLDRSGWPEEIKAGEYLLKRLGETYCCEPTKGIYRACFVPFPAFSETGVISFIGDGYKVVMTIEGTSVYRLNPSNE